MFLYWLASENRYVHRLSDIPKGVESERVDVPTNTEGLMAYLNDLVRSRSGTIAAEMASEAPIVPDRELPVRSIETREVPDHDAPLGVRIEAVAPPVEYVRRPMDAGSILSRVDSPGVDVEAVVEAIGKSKGYALRRYAGAVAVRFQELENKS